MYFGWPDVLTQDVELLTLSQRMLSYSSLTKDVELLTLFSFQSYLLLQRLHQLAGGTSVEDHMAFEGQLEVFGLRGLVGDCHSGKEVLTNHNVVIH